MLKYKAEETEGCSVVEVDARYSSQQCSECGKMVYKELSQRIHQCPFCGIKLDRDVNAASVLLKRACGRMPCPQFIEGLNDRATSPVAHINQSIDSHNAAKEEMQKSLENMFNPTENQLIEASLAEKCCREETCVNVTLCQCMWIDLMDTGSDNMPYPEYAGRPSSMDETPIMTESYLLLDEVT